MQDQLNVITNMQLRKSVDDQTYNSVIDHCNDVDKEVAQFFQAVVEENLEEIKRFMLVNPTIAFEVNDQMETVLHLAVALRNYDLVEYFVEHEDCGRALLKAVDVKKQTPLDLARKTGQ